MSDWYRQSDTNQTSTSLAIFLVGGVWLAGYQMGGWRSFQGRAASS
jgi:hypothetical protein